MERGLLLGVRTLVLHLAGCCVGGLVGAADRRASLRKSQRGVRRAVGHLLERRLVDVTDVVAGCVVARVEGNPCRAAVDRRLLGGLYLLGTGKETTGRDAGVYERLV